MLVTTGLWVFATGLVALSLETFGVALAFLQRWRSVDPVRVVATAPRFEVIC